MTCHWLAVLNIAFDISMSIAGVALIVYVIWSVTKDVLAYRRRKARIVAVYKRTKRE